MRRRARHLAGLAAALLLAAGLLAAAGSPAAAHAALVATDPPNGAQLDQPPAEIRLRFSEPVRVSGDGVQLRDADGAPVTTAPASPAAGDPTTVVLPVPPDLPEGGYVVSYRVVSDDSHPVAGALAFGLGVAATPASEIDLPADDPAVAAAFAVARWAGYGALALLAGGLGMLVLCWPGGWSDRRARRVLRTGWAVSLIAAVAVLLLQGPYAAGRTLAAVTDPALLSDTLGTDYGIFVLARLLLVLAAAVLVFGRPAAGLRRPGAATVAVALPATWLGTGHTSGGGNPLDLVADLAHLLAMSSWFGGLALLVVCVLPRAATVPGTEAGGVLRRFSLLATGAVATLVVTGGYVAWRRVGSLDALVGTPYGRLLAFKLATLGVLLWLGAMSRSIVQRRYAQLPGPADADTSRSKRRAARDADQQEGQARGQLRQSVRLEAGVAVAVLAVASVLVATPPGVVVTTAEAAAAAATRGLSGPVQHDVYLEEEQVLVQVRVEPAWAGANELTIAVTDLGFRPVDVPEVQASFSLPEQELGPVPVDLVRLEAGSYRAGEVLLPLAGQWELEVAVRTTEIDLTRVRVDVPVA